jgi:cytochrome P450
MDAKIDALGIDRANILDLDIGSPETKKRLRALAVEWAQRPPFYVLRDGHVLVICGRHADVLEVYRDQARFSSVIPKGPGYEMFDKFMGVRVLAQMDGEPHARIRQLMAPAFSPKSIGRLEAGITDAVDRTLDDIESGGPEFDAMEQYGSRLIVESLLTVMLGLSPEEKAVFLRMHHVIPLITYTQAGHAYPDECIRAFADARILINSMIAERRTAPREDFITDLIQAHDNDDRLNDEELFDQVFTVCAGALSGTTLSFGSTLYSLYYHPETIGELRSKPALIPQAIEEAQRWHSGSYLSFPRFAQCDTEVGGTPIKKDMVVRVSVLAAHSDPTVYPDPSRFDIHRGAKNLAFGSGPHLCIGQRMAKLAMRIGVDRLINRFPEARLKDRDMELNYVGSVGELRIKSLPMIVE